jgi:hypothetical protein
MPIFTPTYGGSPIFGLAVHIEHVPRPCAQQTDAFFGVPGQLSLFGGSRGRQFQVSGVLFDYTIGLLNFDESIFLTGTPNNFADGVARLLIDTRGRYWPNVVYIGEFQPDQGGPKPMVCDLGAGAVGGWGIPYRAVFHGLS